MRLRNELLLRTIRSPREFRRCDFSRSSALGTVHDDRRVSLACVFLVLRDLEQRVDDLAQIIELLFADRLLDELPDEAIRDRMAAKCGNAEEFRGALCPKQVIRVDRPPDAILSRFEMCFR